MDELAERALAIAVSFHRKGDLESAEICYRKLIKEHPNLLAAYHFLATLCAQKGHYERAIIYFNKALVVHPETPHTINCLGNCYKAQGKLDEAEQHYQRAILFRPKYASAYNNIGTLHQMRGDYQKAQSYYLQAVAHEPDYADPHYNLGLCAIHDEEWHQAQSNFEQSLVLDGNHPKANMQLGICLLQNSNPHKAMSHFKKQIALDPNCIQSHYHLGNIFHAFYDYPAAAKNFERVIALQPDHKEANFNAGICYLATNDFARAMPHFIFLLQKDRDLDVLFNLGVIFMRQDKHKQAIEYFEEILSIDPQNKGARQNLANIYLSMKSYPEAIAQYQILLAQNPDDAQYQFTLAGLQQRGRPDQPPTAFIQDLFDHYADHYEKHLKTFLHYDVPHQLFGLFERDCDISPSERKILDLGCGTGLCGELFAPLCSKIIGIDLSEKMIEESREKLCYDLLEQIDAISALNRFKNNQVIIAADLLPYIGDISALFSAVSNSLSDDGVFLFSCEKTANTKDFELQQSLRYAHSKHYIAKCLADAGLEIMNDANAILRQQHNKPLEGHLYLTKRCQSKITTA